MRRSKISGKKKSIPNKTTKHLAKEYHCSPRTIQHWRQEGAPLNDPVLMRTWLASRKNIPPHLPCASQPVNAPATGSAPKTAATIPQPEHLGGSAAYERLNKAEFAAHDQLEKSSEAGDTVAMKAAIQNWLRINKERRETERHLTADQRKIGTTVLREEVERALEILGRDMQQASEALCPQLATQFVEADFQVRTYVIMRKAFYAVALGSYALLTARGVPRWMVDALTRYACGAHGEDPEHLDELTQALVAFANSQLKEAVIGEPKVIYR